MKFSSWRSFTSPWRARDLTTSNAEYDRHVVATRAQLDQPQFAAAWAEGRAMTPEQSVREIAD